MYLSEISGGIFSKISIVHFHHPFPFLFLSPANKPNGSFSFAQSVPTIFLEHDQPPVIGPSTKNGTVPLSASDNNWQLFIVYQITIYVQRHPPRHTIIKFFYISYGYNVFYLGAIIAAPPPERQMCG
jgi:hypothetical protein